MVFSICSFTCNMACVACISKMDGRRIGAHMFQKARLG
jgi:hypothetical protein